MRPMQPTVRTYSGPPPRRAVSNPFSKWHFRVVLVILSDGWLDCLDLTAPDGVT